MSVSVRRNYFGCRDLRSFDVPSLIKTQIESYFGFLYGRDSGISCVRDVFTSVFPIHAASGNASVEFVDYRIGVNKLTVEGCVKKKLTYSVPLYITIRLITFTVDQENGEREIKSIKEQEIQLCTLPLMTDRATFIINGIERVVVSQIHRTPGVFFTREFSSDRVNYLSGIIPYRGSWLEFVFDNKDQLYFAIDKKKKLPICTLLLGLNLSRSEIISNFYESIKLFKYKGKFWKTDIDLSKMIGQRSLFTFFDSNGAIFLDKGKLISRGVVQKASQIETGLYVSEDDLISLRLYKQTNVTEHVSYDVLTEIQDTVLEQFEKSNLEEFEVINSNIKGYSNAILHSLLLNPDMDYVAAMLAIFKNIRIGDPFVLEEAEKTFHDLFFNKETYSLFQVGRHKINSVLGLNTDKYHTVLTNEDIILTLKHLLHLKENNLETDDIDHLSNRRIRSVGELIENQMNMGLAKMSKVCVEKLSTLDPDKLVPSEIIVSNFVSKSVRDFFMLSQLSQFTEQTNPLSELAHKRRISSFGVGGINRDRAGIEVRDVHPTHYGRICPIETPEGQNIGLINSLSIFAKINKYGFIETPYRKIVDSVVTDEVVYMDANEEYKYVICQSDGGVVKNDKIVKDMVSARKGGDFVMVESKEVEFMDASPNQIVSINASLIPFLESNDAARALMGSNMQRQAVPLVKTEPPIVGSGIENLICTDSGYIVTAKREGVVVSVDAEEIIVKVMNSDNVPELDVYKLKKYIKTNQNTCINQLPAINVGDHVTEGSILSDGPSFKNGEIALGKNILVAFMPWNGYGFEDSIVISEKVVHDDLFTSVHIEEFEVVVRDTRLGPEEITRDIPNVSDEALKNVDESGVVNIGAEVKPGDILVGKVTPKGETLVTPEEKLLRAIFGEKMAEVKDSSLRLPSGVTGTVIDVKILTRRGVDKDQRALSIEADMLKEAKESYSYKESVIHSFFNGELDKILLKKKIPSSLKKFKTSSGMFDKDILDSIKIFEKFKLQLDSETSKALKKLNTQYDKIITLNKTEYNEEVSAIVDGDDLQQGVLRVVKVFIAMKNRIQPGDKMSGRHGNKGVVSRVVSVEDMPFMKDGTPVQMVLNPLGLASRMNIGQILEVHLGFAMYGIGKQIGKMLKEKKDATDLRTKMLEVLTDNNLKKDIKSMSDKEIVEVAESYSNGVFCATPVFDGAKIEDIESALEIAGFDKSGQVDLYDGKTGEKFDRQITVGYMYILKLHHLVDGKMHARSVGPYSLVTQQPLGGKSHFGGQRLGEMECWALQAYGAAYTLQEMLTVKSDDVEGRIKMYSSIVKGELRFDCGIPESFNVMLKELRSLCLNVQLN